MDINLIAVIVGIVEGLTEFVPVSSTGHMIIVGNLLGFEGRLADVFDVFIQLGAILSVIVIYKDRFERFLTKDGWDVNKGFSAWHVAAGIVPVMLLGYVLHGYIKAYLFSPFTVAIGLIGGSILMLAAEHTMGKKNDELISDVDKISLKDATKIGAFQIFAMWPGFSRSGSTLAGSLFTGVNRDAGAQYSFVIAVPLMMVACLYDLMKNWAYLSSDDIKILAIGFIVSAIVAYFTVVWFLKFLHKYNLAAFAYYRILLAFLTLWYFYL